MIRPTPFGFPRIVRGSIVLVGELITVALPTPRPAEAVVQQVYTLPFYDSFYVSQGFTAGSHNGIDYVIGVPGV